MGLYRDIIDSLKRNNRIKKSNPKFWDSKQEMPYNIYEPGINLKDHVKKFHWIHWVYKTKFLIPLVYVFEKLLGKYIEKTIPDYWHNRNIKVFDRAFDAAISDFWCFYISQMKGQNKFTKGVKDIEGLRKVAAVQAPKLSNIKVLNTMRKIMYTMILNDTAYKEFFNMLMYNIFMEMRDEYKKSKRHKHLIYGSTNMFDIDYFLIGKRLYDTGELPKDYHGQRN